MLRLVMGENLPPARVSCRVCKNLHCREPKYESGFRVVRNVTGDELAYNEPVIDCLVIQDKAKEDYMLWVFGWMWLVGP